MNTKLIILRGPSASGKSTVAREIVERSDRKIAWLEEDHFRRVILQTKEPPELRREICKQMLSDNARTLLSFGFDVVVEGILSKKHYIETIEGWCTEHAGESYIFHFDVSLEETFKRHQTKPIADNVTDDQLREWYAAGAPLGLDAEELIPESFSKEQAISHIQKVAGL